MGAGLNLLMHGRAKVSSESAPGNRIWQTWRKVAPVADGARWDWH